MEQLRAGAATVTDDAAQGRGASLAASLDYGFTQAFTDDERAVLALLALFQGFIDVAALRVMGDPDMAGRPGARGGRAGPRGGDRAAGPGRRSRPAHRLRRRVLRRPPRRPLAPAHPVQPPLRPRRQPRRPPRHPRLDHRHQPARQLLPPTSTAQGHTEVIGVLGAEEANLLHARRLALTRGWHDLVLGAMQGLRILYDHTGRTIEWRRLVDELIPEFTDPATGGPRPGREEQWALLTGYRVRIARDARDWPAARQLQTPPSPGDASKPPPPSPSPAGELDDRQRNQIRSLAAALFELGQILREQDDPGCVQPYQKPWSCTSGSATGAREGTVAFNLGHAYKDIPALRDLDQAEQWYQRDLELLDEHDTLGRARSTGQLGNRRLRALRRRPGRGGTRASSCSGTSTTQLAPTTRHSSLLPDDAVDDLAVTHHAAGQRLPPRRRQR